MPAVPLLVGIGLTAIALKAGEEGLGQLAVIAKWAAIGGGVYVAGKALKVI